MQCIILSFSVFRTVIYSFLKQIYTTYLGPLEIIKIFRLMTVIEYYYKQVFCIKLNRMKYFFQS